MILLLAIIGALIFRMRGGLPPSLPRPIDQVLFSLPFGYIALQEASNYYIAGLVFVLVVIAVIKGHGAHMDLGTWKKDRENEWYEWTISWFRGKIPEYWYDTIGLAISGITYTLPLALCAPQLLWVGALKAPSYMLGKLICDNSKRIPKKKKNGEIYKGVKWLLRHFDVFTELGELFTGFLLWGVAAIYIL